jgi:hypothetical protein
MLARIHVIQASDADLPQVIFALRAPRRLAGSLNGRKQQGDENADNRDNDQQLD